MRVLAILALIGCEQDRVPDPPPPPPPVPVPAPIVDERIACRTDKDCDIYTSCCAHCNPGGTVVAVNEEHRAIGQMLTITFYCPSCAEGGCTTPAPDRTPICKRGACAWRETTYTDWSRTKIASTRELDNAPGLLDDGDKRLVGSSVMHRACMRLAGCGEDTKVCAWFPSVPRYEARAPACTAAIDQLSCADLKAGLLETDPANKRPLPAACDAYTK